MNISIYKPVITPDAFCPSIEKALRCPPDIEGSIRRIQNTVNSLPSETLYISRQKNKVIFYSVLEGKQTYLPKHSDRIYPLARKRYLLLLLEILQLTESKKPADIRRRESLLKRLKDLIHTYAKGNLDLRKIVLTGKQYKWYTGDFRQKHIDPASALKTASGIPVRSKSERDIINASENLAVPLHYEEQSVIYVRPLVEGLRDELLSLCKTGEERRNFKRKQLYHFQDGSIWWNVPPELEWMNTRGSIWKSYYPPDGTIAIYNDIIILLADGTFFFWEHEGLIEEFVYRRNATERTAVMRITGTADRESLLETYEQDVDCREKINDILERYILPRLWF